MNLIKIFIECFFFVALAFCVVSVIGVVVADLLDDDDLYIKNL